MLDPDLATIGEASEAYEQLLATAKQVMNEVASRRSDVLPGLLEHLQDHVVLTSGGTSRPALGWYQCGAWQHDGRSVDEIFLNADRRGGHDTDAAEDVLTTLLHEAAHAWNSINRVGGTSNRGLYHNKRFAEAAVQLGLSVTRNRSHGHRTPGLQDSARHEFADLLSVLDDALVIIREPERATRTKGTKGTATAASIQAAAPLATSHQGQDTRYVFASCGCKTSRGGNVTLRMARGSWRPDITIWCSACGTPFLVGVSSIVLRPNTEVSS